MFENAYNQTRKFEGGYANHPADRGGATIFGISSKYWPNDFATVKTLVDQGKVKEAEDYTKEFYKKNFWDPSGAEKAPPEMQAPLFDAAVNHGVGTAKKMLASSNNDPNQFLDQRQGYMNKIVQNDPSQAVFQKGWQNRVQGQRPVENMVESHSTETIQGNFANMQKTPVSDPALLQQLEAPERQPVSDPALLAQLEEQAPVATPQPNGIAEQAKDAVGAGLTFMQGRTLGMGTKPMAALGATMAYPIVAAGKTIQGKEIPAWSDLYKTGVSGVQNRVNTFKEEHPAAGFIAELAGGLRTGGQIAKTGIGQKVSSGLGNGLLRNATGAVGKTANLATKAGLGGALSYAGDKLYKVGTSEVGKEGDAFRESSALATTLGAALPVVGTGLSQLNKSLGKTAPAPSADEIRKQASNLYKEAAQKGGTLKPEFTDKFVDAVEALKPQTKLGKMVGGKSEFSKVVDRFSKIRGNSISLDEAQELDELLGDAIDEFTEMGKLTKQGVKLRDIQSTFRNMIEDADPSLVDGGKEGFNALKDARKLWSTSRRLADVEKIIQRAELMDNPATGIKSGFRTLLNNPNRLKGFTKEEQAAIKNAAETGELTDLLRTGGSKLLSLMATAKGGPAAGAITYAGSALSKNAATNVQMKKATDLADLIARQGKPAVKTPLIGGPKTPKQIQAAILAGQVTNQ